VAEVIVDSGTKKKLIAL
jgi:transcriptional antiterminator RfaH